MKKKLAPALIASLFMSPALIAPAHAGLFDFKPGGEQDAGQPSGPDGAQGEARNWKSATSPTAP